MAKGDSKYSNSFLRLCAQDALLSHVVPSLRSVSIEYKEGVLYWQSIFDIDAKEEEIDLAIQASTEFLANFQDVDFQEVNKVLEFPNKMIHLENLVYERHEHNYFEEI